MRVVYDTSVLTTIVSRRGLILQLKSAIAHQGLVLITSPYILTELENVLSSKFGLTRQGAKSRVRLLARIADVVQPEPIESIARDSKDDPVIATAVAGHAEFLVTLDNDLLVLKHYKTIRIVDLEEFVAIINRPGLGNS